LPGRYELLVHNGRGGPRAWSQPLAIEVVSPDPWPTETINVVDYGAEGRGTVDDTAPIQAALSELAAKGGGVLYFPRGRYLVTGTLEIPQRTLLRGQKRELSAICWPDSDEPLADLLVGTHSFAIEDLSFYCANNTLSCWFGGDNELTSDGSGAAYFGKVASVEGNVLVTDDDPDWGKREWHGAAVLVVGGRGVGQYRRVMGYDGRRVELDRAWDVPPDADSQLTVTMYQGDYLLLNNRAVDIGVVQFYGTSVNHICAGNRSARTAGFYNMGMKYYGIQPSWYVQWLDNVIEEGNGYDSAHRRLPRGSELAALGKPPTADFPYALNLGSILRRNRLANNAKISVGHGEEVPTVRDAIVEANRVEDNDVGIQMAPGAVGVLLRENQFERVGEPIRDLGQVARKAAAARERLAGLREPLAAWDFRDLRGVALPDRSGNGIDAKLHGSVELIKEGPAGSAARFDGASYLQVGANGDVHQALFNQSSLTLSVWMKPETVKGRQGLLSKRFRHCGPPFVLSILDGAIQFEGADPSNRWSHNFRSPPMVVPDSWQHVAAVVEDGCGVRLYYNGKRAAEKEVAETLLFNDEPLLIGREAWAGSGAGDGPVCYRGMIGPITIWARALSDEELAAELGGE